MAITILPREDQPTSWYDVLGSSLGTLAGGLLGAKAKQMKRKYQAENYKTLGYSPEIAYQPKAQRNILIGKEAEAKLTGLKAMQAHHQANEKTISKIHEFNALANEALTSGVPLNLIKNAEAMGPEAGTERLKYMIKEGIKPKPEENFLQTLLGGVKNVNPYKVSAADLEEQQTLAKYGYGPSVQPQYFQDVLRALNPTPEDKQRERQEAYNAQLQQMQQQNPPKNTLDVINQQAASNLYTNPEAEQANWQQRETQLENAAEQEKNARLEAFFNDPNVPAEEKEALREKMLKEKGGYTGQWGLGTIPSVLGNLATGAATTIGTAGGIAPMLPTGDMSPEQRPAAIAKQQEIMKNTEPGTVDHEDARSMYDYLISHEPRTTLPTRAEIKENVVRPLAKMIHAEDYIDSKNPLESFARVIGELGPMWALSTFAQGGTKLQNLIQNLDKAIIPNSIKEMALAGAPIGMEKAILLGQAIANGLKQSWKPELAGIMTTQITGSELLGKAVSTGWYFKNLVRKADLQKPIDKAIKDFDSAMQNTQLPKQDGSPLLDYIDRMEAMIANDPDSEKSKWLSGRIKALYNKVFAGVSANDVLIDPKKLHELDSWWGNMIDAAKQHGVGAQFQEGLDTVRSIYQDAMMKVNPEVVRNFIDAGIAQTAINDSEKIAKGIKVAGKGLTIPEKAVKYGGKIASIFGWAGRAARALAPDVGGALRYMNLVKQHPMLMEEAVEVLAAAANGNRLRTQQGLLKLGESLSKEVRKKQPKKK